MKCAFGKTNEIVGRLKSEDYFKSRSLRRLHGLPGRQGGRLEEVLIRGALNVACSSKQLAAAPLGQ